MGSGRGKRHTRVCPSGRGTLRRQALGPPTVMSPITGNEWLKALEALWPVGWALLHATQPAAGVLGGEGRGRTSAPHRMLCASRSIKRRELRSNCMASEAWLYHLPTPLLGGQQASLMGVTSLEGVEEVLDVESHQVAGGQGVQPANPGLARVQHLPGGVGLGLEG